MSYIPKRGKNALILSMKHGDAVTDPAPPYKPEIIKNYNQCNGGVDTLDQVIYSLYTT